MKDYKERNNFILRTTFWKSLVFMRLKSATQKLNFVMAVPILESKGMGGIFQKKDKEMLKKGKIFEALGKNV